MKIFIPSCVYMSLSITKDGSSNHVQWDKLIYIILNTKFYKYKLTQIQVQKKIILLLHKDNKKIIMLIYEYT